MRVLFIEDEAAARSGLTALLASQGDIVDSAESCEAAEKAFRTTAYDLVILDIMLPAGQYECQRGLVMKDAGATLLDDLRRDSISGSKTKPDVPVVALTAIASTEIHERICRHHAVYLAVKPIDPEEVVQLIRSVIADGNAMPNNRTDTDAE